MIAQTLLLLFAAQADPIGRWVSTHEDLGGVHALAALPEQDDVAVLNAETGIIRMGLDQASHTFDWSQSLHQPQGLSIAANGRIFVADTGHHRVMYFSSEGDMIGGFGGSGDGPVRMRHPHAIDVNDTIAAVADTGHNRIQIFGLGGEHIRNLEGDALGLNRPEGVAIDDAGKVWIADTQNHRILCTDQNGDILHELGSWGTFPGQFMEPCGIDARGGRVVVTDRLNHRVQVFDANTAESLDSWGMHAVFPRQGEGKVHYPADAALLPDGDIVIAEPFEERVQRFGPNGTDIEPPSLGPRGVQSHFGPVAATDGRFFCTWEPELRAIHVFDLDRKTPLRLSTFGEPGDAAGQLGHLTAIEIDATNNLIWAVDAGNQRIHEWTINPPPPDKPRFDSSMATLRRSAPLPTAGPGELGRNNDELIYLDQAGNTAWLVNGTGQHAAIDLALGRDPRAIILAGKSDEGQRVAAVLDGISKVIRLHGPWPQPENRVTTIDLADLIDPVDFAQTQDGSFVVVDRGGHRIHRFGIDGTHLNTWGEQGSDHGQLWRPAAVVVDHHNRVIVLDHGNHRAQMFEPDGTWIMTFGAGRAWTTRPTQQETE
jgi:sugar lactone lactonase YvrE